MPLIYIPVTAKEKAVYYAAVIAAERLQLKDHMGDFFERRWEGYIEAVGDLTQNVCGFIVCEHDAALESFLDSPPSAEKFLIENYPTDFTTKRLVKGGPVDAKS